MCLLQILTAVSLKSAVCLWQVEQAASLLELLRDVHIPLYSRFLVAQPEGHFVLLSEVYHIAGQLQLRRFGMWSRNRGIRTTTWDDFCDRRSNLQGAVINVSSVEVSEMCCHCLLDAVAGNTYMHVHTTHLHTYIF
jgi:hypothetical protein